MLDASTERRDAGAPAGAHPCTSGSGPEENRRKFGQPNPGGIKTLCDGFSGWKIECKQSSDKVCVWIAARQYELHFHG